MFKLTENYGGKPKVRYFRTFNSAVKALPTSIFWRKDLHSIDGDHLPENIAGMKKATIMQDTGFFHIFGTAFAANEKDEYSLDKCEVTIEEIDFEPHEDTSVFYEVMYCAGYADVVVYGDIYWERSEGFFHTKEDAMEEYKKDCRCKSWETLCGPLDHTGRYIAIATRRISD